MEDEHHFLFDCPAPSELVMPVFSSVLVQYQTFLLAVNQMHVVDSLGTVFLLKEISDKMKFA